MDNNGMYDSLLEKIRHFVALYEKVKAEKAELEQKAISLQKQVSFLQNENNQLKTDNELLNMKLSEQTKKVAELSDKVSNQDNVNSEIESKLMAILSALPDDKDDSNEPNSETPINIFASEQNVMSESTAAQTVNMPQQEEDPADAILNKFMSYDTESEKGDSYIENIGFAAEPASQNNDEPINNNENVDDSTANDINEYVGLFDEHTETVESDQAENQPSSLFGDTLPTEEEWNNSSTEQPFEEQMSAQNDDGSIMSFFDEQNAQNEQDNVAEQNQESQPFSDDNNQSDMGYAGNNIQSDDYSSILLSDDDGEEEVDFDMDDDEGDEPDDDVSGNDYEDGYAPGVM